MFNFTRRDVLRNTACASLALVAGANASFAKDMEKRAKIDADADAAFASLISDNDAARALSEKASAFLIFPKITEIGIAGIGAERGTGVLRQNGESLAYYHTTSASFGIELGFATHGYVVMFMTREAAQDFASKRTYEFGGEGQITVFKAGATADANTTNLKTEVVAFVFDEKGAMINLTLEGTAITLADI